ncbi:MAG: hypothetical protein WCL50_10135, partial [Spirochaetota bacterium]
MKHHLLIPAIALSILVAGCQFLTLGNESTSTTSTTTTTTTLSTAVMSAADVASFQKLYMSSYYAARSGLPQGLSSKALTPFLDRTGSASKATVPLGQLTTVTFGSLAPLSFSNYPEPLQTTTFTATLVSGTPTGTKVYDVTATTTFPSGDLRTSYVEEYYVQDIGLDSTLGWNTGLKPDVKWTVADPIVKKVAGVWVLGTNSYLTQDQLARLKQVLTFADGTTRSE